MGLAARLPIPANPIGNYISGAFSIKQSDAGLRFSSVKLGYLPLPSLWLVPALEAAVNWYGGENQGTLFGRVDQICFRSRMIGLISSIIRPLMLSTLHNQRLLD